MATEDYINNDYSAQTERRAVPRISEEPKGYFYQELDKVFQQADDRQLQSIIQLAQQEQTLRDIKAGRHGMSAKNAVNATINRLEKMATAVGQDMPKDRITQAIEDEARVTQAIQGKEYHADKASGALSGFKAIRMDLIPRSLLKLVAERFEYGTEVRKYPKNNWKQGIGSYTYVLERINHLILHAHKLVEPKRTDDEAKLSPETRNILDVFRANLGAIAWGCAFLAEALESEEGQKAILQVVEF